MTSTNGNGTAVAPKYGDMRDYRAPSLLQPHRARQAIRDAYEGKIPPLMGCFHTLGSPPMCKVIAQLGFDVLLIDQEHSAMNIETMVNMVNDIQHISEGRTIAWVRVAGHDHDTIGYALDSGASIMIPQVHTVAEAKHALSSCKFGAKNNGTRSAPPARYLPGISDTLHDPSLTFWESLNQQAAVIIQLESREGVRNLDAVLTECGEHIDACFLGSLDLRASMGLGGGWGDEPEFLETVKLFSDTLIKHDKPRSGGVMGPPEVRKAMGSTTTVAFTTMDIFGLVQTSLAELAEAREMFPAKNFKAKNHGGGKLVDVEAKKIEKSQVAVQMADGGASRV